MVFYLYVSSHCGNECKCQYLLELVGALGEPMRSEFIVAEITPTSTQYPTDLKTIPSMYQFDKIKTGGKMVLAKEGINAIVKYLHKLNEINNKNNPELDPRATATRTKPIPKTKTKAGMGGDDEFAPIKSLKLDDDPDEYKLATSSESAQSKIDAIWNTKIYTPEAENKGIEKGKLNPEDRSQMLGESNSANDRMNMYNMDHVQNTHRPAIDADDDDIYTIKPVDTKVGRGGKGKTDDMEVRMKMLQAERDVDIPQAPNRV